jgi:(1->4)-alpha-D-glucan 1-alpha-D-glucosylmutase
MAKDKEITPQFLEKLADLCGVQPHYYDIWGKKHEVSAATRRVFLRAMGLTVEDDRSVWAEILRYEDEPWTRVLPPVLVLRENAFPCTIPLVWPHTDFQCEVQWRLIAENGAEFCGTCAPSALPASEQRTIQDEVYSRLGFELSVQPGLGYHRLEVRGGDRCGEMALIVVPETCYAPGALADGRRVWGVSVQLYGVKSERNWGVGDFTDLRHLVDWCADAGADAIGLNPLHALFPHDPDHCSPYDPSHRRFLNMLYLDVEAVPEFSECDEARQLVSTANFQDRLQRLRASELVDYRGVRDAKVQALEILYRHFRTAHLQSESACGKAFLDFQVQGGRSLHLFALFDALQEHLHRRDKNCWGFLTWPEEYRHPDSPAVREFAANHRERVEFFQYVQWRAGHQLEACGNRSLERGLGIGMYFDMALSVNGSGAEAWEDQELFVRGVGLGAPPDDFNSTGQDWGLPPFHPRRMGALGYGPFSASLRYNMKWSGALRLDHVMGLMRLFWVPAGSTAVNGAYVSYPFEDLLGIVALESRRNQCLVVGEDLGTVPNEIRHALRTCGVFSYSLLYFEKRWDGEFKSPGEFPNQALTAVSTHDLPTLAGYWKSRDLEWRTQLGLFPDREFQNRLGHERQHDRARLLAALNRDGLLPPGMPDDPEQTPELTVPLSCAVHEYLARATSQIAMVQLEDIFARTEQANLPGTVDQHPNWRRKVDVVLEEYGRRPEPAEFVSRFARQRPRA